jgi:hypothetical protein
VVQTATGPSVLLTVRCARVGYHASLGSVQHVVGRQVQTAAAQVQQRYTGVAGRLAVAAAGAGAVAVAQRVQLHTRRAAPAPAVGLRQRGGVRHRGTE